MTGTFWDFNINLTGNNCNINDTTCPVSIFDYIANVIYKYFFFFF